MLCASDIDECHLFPLGQPGRLCIHQCVNTPGSFHCICPPGYSLASDGRSCTGQLQRPACMLGQHSGRAGEFWIASLTTDLSFLDKDECENQAHNCTADQLCVNTYGGFQCVTVECPKVNNATFIKTSPM